MSTGASIRSRRVALGLTPSELAALAGLTDGSHLRKIESDRVIPRLDTWLKIDEALKEAERASA